MIGTTGGMESDHISDTAHKSSAKIKRNAGLQKQDRQMPKDCPSSGNLNPATLYQLHHHTGLTLNEDNRRHSSLSQHHGEFSHSSNLNYSPATTIGKRSNSQSTQNRGLARLRSESPAKSRGSRRSRLQSKQKSTESKRSAARKQQVPQPRVPQQKKLDKSKMSVVNHFSQSKKLKQLRRPSADAPSAANPISRGGDHKPTSAEVDRDDLVIYVIITQAARMIQRAFRAYLTRKRLASHRSELRDVVETERVESRLEYGS